MHIQEWMGLRGYTDADMARLLNEAQSLKDRELNPINYRSVQKWRCGKRMPRKANLELIYRVTGGEVDANSFINIG